MSAVESATPADMMADLARRTFAAVRRRWLLASFAFLSALGPMVAYAMLAVPTYAARGTLQVSSRNSSLNPLLDLAGADGASEVETEVEIVRRREMVLDVLKNLRLDIVDPHAPTSVTTDLAVARGNASPISDELRRVRASIAAVELDPYRVRRLPFSVTGIDHESVEVTVGDPGNERTHLVHVGEPLVDEIVTLTFSDVPVEPGETVELGLMPEGVLLEDAMDRLRVAAVGTSRKTTNLVEVSFTHADREIARAVVQGLMQRYLDESLQWQRVSASSASDFIEQQLETASARLKSEEDALRRFAEAERAVQLDTQAQVTIQSTADMEAERLRIELEERAMGSVIAGMKKKTGAASANLSANFFQDPVLATSVGKLTENETKLAVLRATLTEDHPQVTTLGAEVALQRTEIARQMKAAQKGLAARRAQLEREIETAMGALATYPDKELQLARHMRDVEVNQRLYAFLLEKHQESEILEASTTTDKRIVESAALPHQQDAPRRGKLVMAGVLGGGFTALFVVYLVGLMQRRIDTVKDLKNIAPYAVYGTVPGVEGASKTERLTPTEIWKNAHDGPSEAFRALAASVSLAPAVPGRGRIVQVTSSQPGEGKSTIIANLAVALSKAGNRVLLIDLDLRRPVQHRGFKLLRGPGYADLISKSGGPKQVPELLQRVPDCDLELLTAGSKLPDTLGAVMTPALPGLLAHCAERYDYVLVDSPPAFVADTSVVSRHVDLLLMVGRPGVAERATTRQAVELLGRIDVPKGLVLNGVTRRHDEQSYGASYYSYRQRYGESAGEG
ncbi:MAG TPA: GNVR domain-containing protein [Nannocystaceae bacterium]|nr:GNVR domain-containing protein [Nannocystaceae bacterium]